MTKEQSHVEQLLNPPKDDIGKRQVSFYVDEKTYQDFVALCKHHNLSGSKVVTAAMKDFVAKYGKKKLK